MQFNKNLFTNIFYDIKKIEKLRTLIMYPFLKILKPPLVYTFADTNIDAVSFINDENRFDGDEIHPQR